MHARYPRVAEAITAILDAGLTKSDIARLAGRDASQVSRWAVGSQRPGYETATQLAAGLRPAHPELAEQLLVASGYAGPGGEPPVPPLISPSLLASIRREVSPEDQERVIEAIERTLAPGGEPTEPGGAATSPGAQLPGDAPERRAG